MSPDDVAELVRDLGLPAWHRATPGDLRLVDAAEAAATAARDETLDAIQAVAEQIAERPDEEHLIVAHRRLGAAHDRHARRVRACIAYRAAVVDGRPADPDLGGPDAA